MNVRRTLPLGAVLATLSLAVLVLPLHAQQRSNALQPPPLIAPLPQPTSPVSSKGTRSAADDAAKLGRDIDAASRRVQSDSVRNDIDRADSQLQSDRARIDRQRAANPSQSGQLRREYDQLQSDHDSWRQGKERQREQLESEPMPPPPPPNEIPPAPRGLPH